MAGIAIPFRHSGSSSSSSGSRYQNSMWFGYGFGSSAASSPSPSSIPPPPPPSPSDSLLDISPRKTSFSSSSGRNTSCAFPSWPNRSSLYSDTESTTTSAYLSDEDLFLPSSPSSSASSSVMDEDCSSPDAIIAAPGLTTEEQINMMNEAEDRDDWRVRQQAQARAQQALRAAQLVAAEQQRRRKRRVVSMKPRTTSSSSSKSRSKV